MGYSLLPRFEGPARSAPERNPGVPTLGGRADRCPSPPSLVRTVYPSQVDKHDCGLLVISSTKKHALLLREQGCQISTVLASCQCLGGTDTLPEYPTGEGPAEGKCPEKEQRTVPLRLCFGTISMCESKHVLLQKTTNTMKVKNNFGWLQM